MVWEMVEEEERRMGKGRFKAGVGNRGEEMRRRERVVERGRI